MKGKIFPEDTAMDWIDCFLIFILGVVYKSSFSGPIMYFSCVLDRHPGNIILKNTWQLLYVSAEGKFKGL